VRVYPLRWDPEFWAWGLRFLAWCSAARYAERLAYPSYLALDAYATGERAR